MFGWTEAGIGQPSLLTQLNPPLSRLLAFLVQLLRDGRRAALLGQTAHLDLIDLIGAFDLQYITNTYQPRGFGHRLIGQPDLSVGERFLG